MIDLDANDLLLFARVAEVGSFSRAAERVRLPKSTVSRRIAALEKRLGERLVNRSSRKLTITDFGVHVLEHARGVAAEVDGALALAQHRQVKPSGRLRVSLLPDLAASALSEMLANFVREHPAIVLDMDLSSRRVDLIGENFDLALRAGDSLEDSDLSARKLAEATVGLYASPAYLTSVDTPQAPDDLLDLHGLLQLTRTGEARGWTLERGVGEEKERWSGTPRQYTLANSITVLLRMAQAGFGVVSVPDFYAREAVQRGLLTRVLPQWNMPAGRIWAVFPGRRLMPARTRAFLDALVTALGDGSEAQEKG
ncbi:LysR family transcriptional regulator [Cupriavidus sp. CuC1]|uniref:LysR family transcriptional regulator n=1 Tax=Cupriavidus sp. CuC1 TaxID=3373131 RepID=UPI0037D4B068